MNKAKTYSKYVVKRKPGSKEVILNTDGTPALGDLIKDNVRITESKAEILNSGWNNKELYVTFYYVEQKEEKQEVKQEEKQEVKKPGRPSIKKED